jgi:hypothetical protein
MALGARIGTVNLADRIRASTETRDEMIEEAAERYYVRAVSFAVAAYEFCVKMLEHAASRGERQFRFAHSYYFGTDRDKRERQLERYLVKENIREDASRVVSRGITGRDILMEMLRVEGFDVQEYRRVSGKSYDLRIEIVVTW